MISIAKEPTTQKLMKMVNFVSVTFSSELSI